MKRSFHFQFFSFIILISLIFGLAGLRPVQAAATGQADLTLTDLGMVTPQNLVGPISEYSLRFNLPVNWAPEGTVKLDVVLSAFFSSLVASESTETISGLVGGDLSVYLNDSIIGSFTLSQPGEQIIQLEFDAALLKLATRGSINVLRIRWDGSISCSMNLLSSVTILPTSRINFGYSENPKILSLNDFPAPFIIENAIEPTPLKIVVAENPTSGELRAVMIIAAGVGQISDGKQSIELIPINDFRPSQSNPQNVILVANSDSLQLLTLSALGIEEGLQTAAGEGLIHIFKPQGGYGLLISGDEEGIIKAAQATSADQVIAAGDARTMTVSGVNPSAMTTGLEDMTLEDLGAGELVFTRPENLVQSVDFFVPAGNQVRADASFNLIISHSQQLDYLSSGLQVKVNGFPAVSLRLTDNTSNQALFTLILPANLIHPGRNKVEFVADLNTRSLCTAPVETVAWLRVSSSSLLHLPLESAVSGSVLAKRFGDFPDAFLSGTGLDDISLIIGPAEFGNLQAAAKLAGELGAALPAHTVFALNALFSNAAGVAQAVDSSMILVGKPSDFANLADPSQFPSLIFNADGTLSAKSALELVSEMEGGDVGYLAIRGFDALSNRILLAILSNNAAGIGYAVNAINTQRIAENNFVIVVDENVQSGWLDEGIATGVTVPSETNVTPLPEGGDPVQLFRTAMLKWAVPTLAVLLAVMLLFIYIEIRQNIHKSR